MNSNASPPAPTWVKNTFQGGNYRIKKLSGPLQMVRLVNKAFYHMGQQKDAPSFWMKATFFEGLKRNAEKQLREQQISDSEGLTGLHMRFQLRDKLAVCKNWSPLDAYIRMNLRAGQEVLAYVGKVKGQPYYDPTDARDPDAATKSANAESGGISLPGGGMQIVIDFALPENRAAKKCISAPVPF